MLRRSRVLTVPCHSRRRTRDSQKLRPSGCGPYRDPIKRQLWPQCGFRRCGSFATAANAGSGVHSSSRCSSMCSLITRWPAQPDEPAPEPRFRSARDCIRRSAAQDPAAPCGRTACALRRRRRNAPEDRPEEERFQEIALLLSQAHALPYHGIENEMLVGSSPVPARMLERGPVCGAVVVAVRVSRFREARPVAGHG